MTPNPKLTPHRYRDTDAEWGTFTVPVRHAAPGGPGIELRFVRLRGREGASQPPVVFLTGGPGLSGIRAGEGRLFPMFDALRARGDVILLDQRACVVDGLVARPAAPTLPDDRVVTREEYLDAIAHTVRVTMRDLASRGITPDALNSNESADDVAMLARTLYGDDARIALLGWSYGSHLAMAIIKRHESLVARAVLAGPEGPDQTYKRPSRIQAHLERLSQRASFDLTAALSRALDRVETHERLGRFDLAWTVSECLADTRALRMLPAWVKRMERGEFRVIDEERLLATAWRALRDELPFSAVRYAFDCASGATRDRLATIEREARETVLGRTIDFPCPEICDAVGSPDLGDEFRAAPTSNVPVMFITGTLDCRTPSQNVEELAPGLSDHRHVVVQDAGHGDLLVPSAVQAAIVRFVGGAEPERLDVSTDTPFVFE